MIQSLRSQGETGKIIVLALDPMAVNSVTKWDQPNLEVVTEGSLLRYFPQLKAVKHSRTRMEFLFTLTPWLVSYTMECNSDVEWCTYLDADLFFSSSVEPIYAQLTGKSIGVVEHRFSWEQRWRERYGKYNVAWVSFRSDESGKRCLKWWAEKCLEWCFDRVESTRFADQKYLDYFGSVSDDVAVIGHPGVDLAPWNLRSHQLSTRLDGNVLVDGEPLVFFHFHGLKKVGKRFEFKHFPYFAKTTRIVRESIYRPYCNMLISLESSGVEKFEVNERQGSFFTGVSGLKDRVVKVIGHLRGDYLDCN
jgi:hypothetical protein